MLPWFTSGRLTPQAIVHNTPLPFATAAAVTSWTATPAETPGIVPQAIVVAGRLYMVDTDDTVSVHDGVWTCVSADGKRYKASELPLVTSVESASVTSPPPITSSLFGKAWIVGPAATGAWAGMDGAIAIASGRGWVFVSPKKGMALYVASLSSFAHLNAAGDWVLGMGAPSIGTVDAPALAWPFGISVENRTTNTPPTGSTRKAYIVGSAPTGVWSGRSGQVAIGPSGGWSYLTPDEGAEVFVIGESRKVRYASGVWTTDTGTLQSIRRVANASALALTGATYVYPAGSAPNVTNTGWAGLQIEHAARAAGNELRIRFRFTSGVGSSGTAGPTVVALFVDGASVALQWLPVWVNTGDSTFDLEFLVSAADAAIHTYSIRIGSNAGTPSNRQMILEEVSVLS